MLKDLGNLSTADIYGHLNDRTSQYSLRHGVTQSSLNNVLGKEQVFVKLVDHTSDDAPQVLGLRGDRYRVSVWGLNNNLLRQYPELEKQGTNSWKLLSES
ncbi:hypothetical protein OAT94_02525 [Schleiferiaceae bacterium]|nr:hypothetical protein [Schleiferiaceae bacterium]